MGGLTTSFLWKLGERILPNFSGVVSCDHLVSKLFLNSLLIVGNVNYSLLQKTAFPDLSRSRSSIVNSLQLKYTFGGHWLSLAYDVHQDRFHFWDPLGFDLTMYPIIADFLLQTRKPVSVYPIKIQSNDSISCGFHSLAFLIHRDFKFDTKEYFEFYDLRHLKRNDEISVDFIKAAIMSL